MTAGEQWRLWDGAVYAQDNPQRTDEKGEFSYFLPAGTYQLRAVSSGYRDFVSEPFALRESQPVDPVVVMEPRLGFSLLGRRVSVPWFLDFWSKKRPLEVSVSLPDIGPPDLGVGEEAPVFELPDQKGEELRLSDFRGSKVLIVLWASWEPLCRSSCANR